MRWIVLAFAFACAGCPAGEPTSQEDAPEPPADEITLPPTNCPRGVAPPITFCRQRHEGMTVASLSVSSSGALYIQDWTNTTANAAGHVETLYGDGYPIEQHAIGTFAGDTTTVCSETGRVQIEHSTRGVLRTYYDLANRMQSLEWDAGADGTFENRHFDLYDADRLVRSYHDAGPGTPADYIREYVYDSRGRVHLITTDRDGDGEVDQTQQRVGRPRSRARTDHVQQR